MEERKEEEGTVVVALISRDGGRCKSCPEARARKSEWSKIE